MVKIIEPSFEIMNLSSQEEGITILKRIERAARTCYKSEDKITEKSYEVLVAKLVDLGHWAMIEHGGEISVKFIVDRGVSHELVRHRLASFAQESTRYCNYAKKEEIVVIRPEVFRNFDGINLDSNDIPERGQFGPSDIVRMYKLWLKTMEQCEYGYLELIKCGVSPQIARSVLPNSLKTEIIITANIREWHHIFSLRCDKPAHPEMRKIMLPLLKKIHELIPIIFDQLYNQFKEE